MRNRLEMEAGAMGNDDLDDLFAVMRAERPEPSADLIARVLADAAAFQPQPATLARPPVRRGLFAAVAALFGGGPVLAGMGSAAVAGLLLGFVQPAPVSALTAMVEGTTAATSALDVSTGIDALLSEE